MRWNNILIAVLGLALTRPVPADTLRCGSALIEVGMKMSEVLDRCGTPTARTTISEPVFARTPAGGTNQVGTSYKEVWTYDRPGKFPAELTFIDGALDTIDFEHSH
jgi:hypothetical protein